MQARQTRTRGSVRGSKLFGVVASATLLASLAMTGSAVASGSAKPAKAVSHVAKPKVGGNIEVVEAGLTWADLDPGVSPTISSDSFLEDAIFDSLFNITAKGQILPGLATSYSESANHLTITINLRHGVKFSDGTPFNAAAVQFNLQRDNTPTCQCYTGISAEKSVSTSGQYKVIVHLSAPSSVFINALALGGGAAYMVSPTALNTEGPAAFQTAPVGAGPFVVQQNLVSSQLTLVKNPHYWDKPKPYLNQVTVVSTGSDAASYASVLGNTAQMAITTDFPTIKQATSNRSVHVVPEPSTTFDFVNPNTITGQFAGQGGLVAREALFEAINQKTIINNLTLGLAPATQSMWAQGELFYPGRKVAGFLSYNPTDAAAKVATLTNAQKSFTFFDCASVTPAIQQLTEALATMWQAVGFNVTIQNYSHTQAIGFLNSGNFQVDACAYGGAIDPALSTGPWISFPSSFNHSYNDATTNAFVARASQTFNKAQRASLYKQAAVQVNQDAAYYPLYQAITDQIASPRLQGFGSIPVVQFENFWLK